MFSLNIKVSILGVEPLLPFCAWLFQERKNASILYNIALKFIEFLKQKVIRFGKVLIESISTFTEKKANAYFDTLINFHSKKSLNRVKS